ERDRCDRAPVPPTQITTEALGSGRSMELPKYGMAEVWNGRSMECNPRGAGMSLVSRRLGAATAATLGLALVISASLPSAAQQAVGKVTITVVGIDRSGTQVAVQSSVVALRGNAVASSGPTYRVPPGTYF